MKEELLQQQAVNLLKELIEIPSFSGEEDGTATILEQWMTRHHIKFQRHRNNVWAVNEDFNPAKPNLLLNSHHDTVRPNGGYTRDPFVAQEEGGKLFGLGSNDAGGCLVSLLAAFTWFYTQRNLNYNLIFAATAEEEINGKYGIASLVPILPQIEVAMVGEPTKMQMAIAEKGLIVFDASVRGISSHAAHPNPDNPIYKTAKVLEWFRDYEFERISDLLGAVKMTVTQISAGNQHNVVPSEVNLVIDVRVNDLYTNEMINEILQKVAPVDYLKARSLRLNSSRIDPEHELVLAGSGLGMTTYGSPTLSDQALLPCPSLKMGPGDSTRSHTADEFIYLEEIRTGIAGYIKILEKILN